MNFESISIGTRHELTDAQKVARHIMDPDEEGIITHWAQYGHLFLSAYILHVLHQSNPDIPTLSTIKNHLMELPSNVLLTEMLSSSNKTVNDVALTLLKNSEQNCERFVKTALTAINDYQKREQLYPAV